MLLYPRNDPKETKKHRTIPLLTGHLPDEPGRARVSANQSWACFIFPVIALCKLNTYPMWLLLWNWAPHSVPTLQWKQLINYFLCVVTSQMGLNKSTLIHRCRCKVSWALDVPYRHLFTLSRTVWSDYDRFIGWLIEPLPIFYAIY